MCFEVFCEIIKEKLERKLGEGYHLELKDVDKNNGYQLKGIIVQCANNISPTIYLNDYFNEFKKGNSIESIETKIYKNFKEAQSRANDLDMSFFKNFQEVKANIVYKVISYEKNKELLEKVPHESILDLAVVFCCAVELNGEVGTILIRNEHMECWQTTKEQLYELAKVNTPILFPYEIRSMQEIISEILGMPLDDADMMGMCPMFVLTNARKVFGASCILYDGVLEKIADRHESDLYILPSSIHEVIIVPVKDSNNASPAFLTDMVKQVNGECVSADEVLSDCAYYFSREKGLKKIEE